MEATIFLYIFIFLQRNKDISFSWPMGGEWRVIKVWSTVGANDDRHVTLQYWYTLSQFHANQSVLFLHNAADIVEKQQNLFYSVWLYSTGAQTHDLLLWRQGC